MTSARLAYVAYLAYVGVLVGAAVGCGRSAAPMTREQPAPTQAVVPIAIDAAPAISSAPPAPPARPGRGDFCKADADCGWDDPCLPARCGKAIAPVAGMKCSESGPPPGSCACVDSQCTLRRDHPEHGASAPGCTAGGCALDVGGGRCALGPSTTLGPITEQGPLCTCAPSGRCDWSWSGPVPCTTWRDCSWTRDPRLRPVPSSLVPRPVDHPVAPCKDGERDAVCAPAGTCRIVAWSC